ncbi:MAG: RNA polymerase sigma factor [Chloroflexi bacterium]|nr:RNA polymerase sigma factor [Chloroflexota bacterium]
MEQSTQATARTNEDWLADLADDGSRQEAALAELREYVRRGLFAFLRNSRSDLARRDSKDVGQMAEDFAQDSLLKILDGLSTFRGESRFTTWAMKIAVRTAVSNLRRAAYRDLSLEDMEARGATLRLPTDASGRPPALPDPQREAERREVLAVIEQAVQTVLSEKQRTAFLATNVDGVPIEVVARLMDSNTNALYKMVHDARRKLRSVLIERGFTFDHVAPLFESS